MYLYLDTTFGATIGLLKADFTWKDYLENSDQKTASLIHSSIDQLCQKNQVQIKSLKGLIQVSGPGGYTGLRVSDGMSQTFAWMGFATYSFYHYEVLSLLSIHEGRWMANAFKGELFIFDQKNKSYSLMKEKDWFANPHSAQLYTNYFSAFSPTAKSQLNSSQFIETSRLIKDNSPAIFSKIVNEARKREIFYYRPIDQEFTKPTSPKNP